MRIELNILENTKIDLNKSESWQMQILTNYSFYDPWISMLSIRSVY
jgi:hypothetical protein